MHFDWFLTLFSFATATLLLVLQSRLRNAWRTRHPEVTSRRLLKVGRVLKIWGVTWLLLTALVLLGLALITSGGGLFTTNWRGGRSLSYDAENGLTLALFMSMLWLPAFLVGKLLTEVGQQVARGESSSGLKWLEVTRIFGGLLIAAGVISAIPMDFWGVILFPAVILMMVYPIPLMNGEVIVRRTERQQRLLFLLTAAVEHQRPLPEEIAAFARGEEERDAERLRKVADLLRTGVSLPDALTRVPGLLSLETVEAIRVAAASRSLEVALRQGTLREDARLQWRNQRQLGLLQVLTPIVARLLIGVSCLMFLMYWIVPKLKAIFEGLHVKIPRSTILLVQCADFFSRHAVEVFSLLLIAMGLFAVLPRWLTGGLTALPFVRSREQTSRIMDQLALLADAGIPWGRGVAAMAGSPALGSVRRKLAAVQTETQRGESLWESLFRHRLITQPETELLQAAERVGNLPWTLRLISDRIDSRQQIRSTRFGVLLQLIGLLVSGLFVGWICVAIFQPLAMMIT